jgi:hypothetical protein
MKKMKLWNRTELGGEWKREEREERCEEKEDS